MRLLVRGIPTAEVERIRDGGADANGLPALTRVAAGVANPCRHCLGLIAEGDDKLVLAHRPFARLQPYAESGPIFLHRRACERYESEALPPWFDFLDPALVHYSGPNKPWNLISGLPFARTYRHVMTNELFYRYMRHRWARWWLGLPGRIFGRR